MEEIRERLVAGHGDGIAYGFDRIEALEPRQSCELLLMFIGQAPSLPPADAAHFIKSAAG